MRTIMFLTVSVLATSAAPALAQDAMSSHDKMTTHNQMSPGAMKMSAGDMRKAKSCNAMAHDAMMKNAGCAKLMKAHPDMMKHDDMMSSGH